MANRSVYVDELFKVNAIESGKNLAEQIKVFQSNPESQAKVLFIIQGRTFKEAREWAWFAYQEIKDIPGHEEVVKGLAMGNTGSGGYGNLADFILRFQTELEFLPKKWVSFLHVLGAGSISRMLAYMVVDDQYFLPDTIVSADATTQTRASVFGNYIYFDPETETLKPISSGRGISDTSMEVVRHMYEFAKPYLDKYKDEYNLQVQDFDSYREHYTEFNDKLHRKKTQFNSDYDYKKRVKGSRFFWTTSMISYYLRFLESVKVRSRRYRVAPQEERLAILKGFKTSFPAKLYKPVKHILDMKSHSEYLAGQEDQIQVGHPYKTVLDSGLIPKLDHNGVVEIKGELWITDQYQGQLLGRKLQAHRTGTSNQDQGTLRGLFMSQMQGPIIETVQLVDDRYDSELDCW